ncbi:circadian-associated transcriptional repressor-like [Aplochiton taeniatus]
MTTSDSDYSIDWLASDEEDYDSTIGTSTQHSDLQPKPSSTTSRKPLLKKERDSDIYSLCSLTTGEDCWGTQTQVYNFVGQQRKPCAFWPKKHFQLSKRARSNELKEHLEKPKAEQTQNDALFAEKCMELQCFIQPLSSILRGLQSGRYSERLSSFQESVAMDRIQRIMGVLQNPSMGERYIGSLLKIEEMLHSWFPHVRLNCDQLTFSQEDDSSPAKRKKYHATESLPIGFQTSLCASEGDHTPRAINTSLPATTYSSAHLRWLLPSPISSPKTSDQHPRKAVSRDPLSRNNLEVTQDNAVSSSTDSQLTPSTIHPYHRRGSAPVKISSPCLERLLHAKESIITPRSLGGNSSES